MSKSYLLGLNIYINDVCFLNDTLASITKDETTFTENIQVNLFDTLVTEESKSICDKFLNKYKGNIQYIEVKEKSLAYCYNLVKSMNTAKYVNYSDSNSIYGSKTFLQIIKFLSGNNPYIFSMHTKFFSKEKGYKEKGKFPEKKYNFQENLVYLPLMLKRYFISEEILSGLNFRDELYEDCTKEALLNAFIHQSEISIIGSTCIFYCDPQERNLNLYPYQTKRWWYIDQMKDFILPFLENLKSKGDIPVHIQALILYIIEIKFHFNRNMRYKYIIRKEEVEQFFQLVTEALSYIDDEIIINHSVKGIAPKFFTFDLLKLKKGKEITSTFKKANDGKEYAFVEGIPFVERNKILVSKQKFLKDEITKERIIQCELFYNYLFYEDSLNFKVRVNGKPYTIEKIEKDIEEKYFGKLFRKKFLFNIRIKKEDQKIFNKIEFSMNVGREREKVKGKLARRKLLGAIKRKIKNGRLCPVFQYMRQWQYILFYMWYRMTSKLKDNNVLMLSDSRAELSGNLAFIDEELRKNNYVIQYFFKRSLKEEKTLIEKKQMCKMMAESKYILVDDFYPIIYAIPLRKRTRLIQVWHAMGAFKTVGFSRLGKPGGPNPRSITHRNYTDTITSADGIRCNYAEAFNMPIENVHATGIPRTDIFFDDNYIKETKEKLYGKYPQLLGKKVVMFAPTFRGNGQNSAHYNFDWIDFAEIEESLGKDYVFINKLHPFIKNVDSVPKDSDFFLDLTSEREINDLLFITDILITDYSSVIFEASLLNINTIFYVPDLDEYTESRDFYYPFEKYTFGKIAKNMDELIDAIQHPKNDEVKLKKFKKHFCESCDGHATKRFVETIFSKES